MADGDHERMRKWSAIFHMANTVMQAGASSLRSTTTLSSAGCPPASSQRGSSVLRREGHKSRSRRFAAVAAIGPMVFLVVMPGSGATQASALSDADAAAQ